MGASLLILYPVTYILSFFSAFHTFAQCSQLKTETSKSGQNTLAS